MVGQSCLVFAVVTKQTINVAMNGQACAAAMAIGNPAATLTAHGGCKPPSVQKNHHLLVVCQGLLDGLNQLGRKAGLQLPLTQIHQLPVSMLCAARAACQHKFGVPFLVTVVQAFQ